MHAHKTPADVNHYCELSPTFELLEFISNDLLNIQAMLEIYSVLIMTLKDSHCLKFLDSKHHSN